MSGRCLRCDPTADLVDNPETHALEAGHPLCARCNRSLRFEEANACTRCVERLLGNLTDLIDAYEALPDEARYIGGTRHTHPGGNLLVLAGPGSEGRTGLTGARLSTGGSDDSHARDEHASDPPSVAFELGSLEQDWRRAFGHPSAMPPASGQLSRPRAFLNGVTRAAIRYLQQHAQWCAASYPDGFVEACEVAWRLRLRVYGALGWLEPRQARAWCLDCAAVGADSQLEQGDAWWCPRCGSVTAPGEYFAALRDGLETRHAG